MSWQASARVEGPDPKREMAFAGQLEARRPDGTPPRISTGEIEAMEARPFHMTASTPKGGSERPGIRARIEGRRRKRRSIPLTTNRERNREDALFRRFSAR